MGLDMYFFAAEKSPGKEIDFNQNPQEWWGDKLGAEKFHAWRKHPNLHGWMEKLYRRKGGKEEFNLEPMVLTLKDLGNLRQDILENNLPLTDGFFFGKSTGKEMVGDLEAVERAIELLLVGKTIIYDASY